MVIDRTRGRRALILGGSVVIVTGLFAGSAVAAPTTQIHTNMPQKWGAAQANAYVTETVADLNGMARGSTFRVADYLFKSPEATEAMIRAYRRGVNVRVVLDGQITTPEWKRLDGVIGHDRSKGSFVYKVHGSGLHRAGRMHAKIIQVSATSARGGRTNMTRIGSQNLSPTNTLSSANENSEWSDPYLYNRTRDYFNQIAADKGTGYRYRTVTRGSVKLYLYPGGPDEVSRALGNVEPGKDCRVFVSIFEWSDSSWQLKKAQQLDSLARRGCKVNVAWNYTPTQILIGPRSGRELLSSGKLGVRDVRTKDVLYSHLKLTAMRYRVNGKIVYRTFSGSQNYLDNRATGVNILVENRDPAVWATFGHHFDRLYAAGRPAVQPAYGPGAASITEDEGDDYANN